MDVVTLGAALSIMKKMPDTAASSAAAAEDAADRAEAAAEQAEGAIEVDDTLSVKGRAADAKKTGDAINDLSEALETEEGRAKSEEERIEALFTQPVEEAVSDWLDDHPEATTTVQDGSLIYKKLVTGTLGFVTPEMFGAKGDGITDDSNAIKAMFNFGIANNIRRFIFADSKTYIVNGITAEQNGKIQYFYLFENITGLEIVGNNTTIKYIQATLQNQCSVFCFRGCKNVTIRINGTCTAYNPSTNAPVIAFIHCIGENSTFDVSGYYSNLRYAFRSGNYNDTVNTTGTGITFLNLIIRCKDVGYPVAVELGAFLNLDINATEYHRVCYLCGVDYAEVNARFITETIITAGFAIYLKDCVYSDGEVVKNKGCSHITINAEDLGTHNINDTSTAIIGIGSYGDSAWTMVNDVAFENINISIILNEGGVTTGINFTSVIGSKSVNYNDILVDVVDYVNRQNAIDQYVIRATGFIATETVTNVVFKCKSNRNVNIGSNATFADITFKDSTFYIVYLRNYTSSEKFVFDKCDFYTVTPATTQASNETKEIIIKNCSGRTGELMLQNFAKYRWISDLKSSGATSERPAGPNYVPHNGFIYFDTTLNAFYYYSAYNTWTPV